jgi:hypothetical protein
MVSLRDQRQEFFSRGRSHRHEGNAVGPTLQRDGERFGHTRLRLSMFVPEMTGADESCRLHPRFAASPDRVSRIAFSA